MKFFYLFFLTIFIVIFLWIGLIFFQLGKPTLMSQWVYDVYQKKIDIAKKINSQKILILAGSNTLFGIDSKMLSDKLNLPVVNFGVNAGLLIPYVLHSSKKVLKEQDIVILPLEYSMYVYDGEANSQMIDYIFAREPSFLKELYPKELFNVFFKVSLKRVLEGYNDYKNSSIKDGLYGSHNVDNRGDQINTCINNRNKDFFDEVIHSKIEEYGKNFKENSISFRYLKKFSDFAQSKNIKLIFIPPTMMYQKEYKTDLIEKIFYENLPKIMKKNNFLFIGNPYDFMYDKDSYFNTNYHLTSKARVKNTKKIINLLEKEIDKLK